MTLPVWLVDDGYGCWWFVATTTRGGARWWVAREIDVFGEDALALSVWRVNADGIIGGRGPRATVEGNETRELTAEERLALGWRVCAWCRGAFTHEVDGLCGECREAQAVDEWYADRDHGRRLARVRR